MKNYFPLEIFLPWEIMFPCEISEISWNGVSHCSYYGKNTHPMGN